MEVPLAAGERGTIYSMSGAIYK